MTGAAKLLGYLWAAPTTLVSAALLATLWVLGQCRPVEWRAGGWDWELQGRGWIFRRLYAAKWAATTLGWIILWAPTGVRTDPRVRAHEGRHVLQAFVLGPLFFPVYLVLFAVYGYRDHPLERDARAAAGERG